MGQAADRAAAVRAAGQQPSRDASEPLRCARGVGRVRVRVACSGGLGGAVSSRTGTHACSAAGRTCWEAAVCRIGGNSLINA